MRATIIGAALLLAGCASATAPTTTTTPPAERLAHYRSVVADMDCKALAKFEQARLRTGQLDNGAALLAIHDRQAELHC